MFREKVRFIGAGTIGVAAIWTLIKIIGPIIKGITAALAANRKRAAGEGDTLALTERDLPITIVFGTILASMIPIALLLAAFGQSGPIATAFGTTLVLTIIYILVAGIVIAAVCGYMAGLIGASNSPISGVGILAVLGISLILAALFPGVDATATQALVALAGRPTLVVVAPPDLDFSTRDHLSAARAFVCDGTAGINIALSTWHWGPYPLMDHVDLVNVQGAGFADDNEVAHLERDLGVVVTVEL